MMAKFPKDTRSQSNFNGNDVHNVLLRMLKIFRIICENSDIPFWLDYGTMLGAIRHGDFIPWDMEADVGVLRTDFNKLKNVIEDFLPKDIFFQTAETDFHYAMGGKYIEAKLRDRYSNYVEFQLKNPNCLWQNGIQVDIFVYDPVSIDGKLLLMNNFEKLLTGGKSYFNLEEINELIAVEFSDTEFYVPAGYDAYLKRNYGDYNQLPPQNLQKPENVDLFHSNAHFASLNWNESKFRD